MKRKESVRKLATRYLQETESGQTKVTSNSGADEAVLRLKYDIELRSRYEWKIQVSTEMFHEVGDLRKLSLFAEESFTMAKSFRLFPGTLEKAFKAESETSGGKLQLGIGTVGGGNTTSSGGVITNRNKLKMTFSGVPYTYYAGEILIDACKHWARQHGLKFKLDNR